MSDTPSLSDRLGDEFTSGKADLSSPARLSAIPSPGDDLPSVARSVRALKQVVDVLTGASGSVLDKAPTVREMLDDVSATPLRDWLSAAALQALPGADDVRRVLS